MRLRILEGNRRKTPIEPEPEPGGVPIKPSGMDPIAELLWDEVVPTLADLGIATGLDTQWLTDMCRWYSAYDRSMAGYEREMDPKLMRAASIAWTNCDKIASRFGLTPADRTRLKGIGKAATKSKTEVYLA